MNLAKLNRLTSIKATGNAFFSEKKYTKALDEYTRGISDIGLAVGRSTPTGSLYKEITVQLLSNRALVYQRLGKLKESIHDCKTALAHDPENVKVLYRLALAYETNQQLEEAFKHISMAKSHDRSSDKAVQRLYKKLETLVTSKEALEHVAAPRPLNRCLEKVYRCAVAACRTCKSVHPARRRGGAADSKGRSYAEEPSVLKPQIEIDEQKIDDLVTNVWMSPENKTVFLDQLELASQSVSRLPIDFQSQEEQINFYGVHAVCSFGMGFSREFRRMFRKPFEDVHTMAMLSMHMATSGHGGARGWDAKFMMGLEVGALASYFQLPLDREERMDAGIYVSKPTPFKPYLVKMTDVLKNVGTALVQSGHADFASFILRAATHPFESVGEAADQQPEPSAKEMLASIVQGLVQLSPAFLDQHMLISKHAQHRVQVGFYRKAQMFARIVFLSVNGPWTSAALVEATKVGETTGEECPANNSLMGALDYLTCLADCDLVSILRNLGVIVVHDADLLYDLEQNGEKDLSESRLEILLRAVSVMAVEKIVERINKGTDGVLSSWQLDLFLRELGRSLKQNDLPKQEFDERLLVLHPGSSTTIVRHSCKSSTWF